MAAQPEGIKSFGSKLNVNFEKLRISQNEAARMFNLPEQRLVTGLGQLDHVHRLWVSRRPARLAFQRRNEFTRSRLE
jgi:hypothetical protein